MRYADAATFRQALEQRLRTGAGGAQTQLTRDRKRVAFERLLARLVVGADGRWLLKGGFALDLRLAAGARSTRDIDVEWHGERDDMLDLLLDSASLDLGDYFVFTLADTGIAPERLGSSRRFQVRAALAGRPFEAFPLDLAFRDDPLPAVEHLTTSSLLSFAGIPPVQVDAIPLEVHVAEKLHAYTRRYEGDRPSTRVKDLVDLALIADLGGLDDRRLADAIATTFERRGTHPVPGTLPPPPRSWAAPYRQLATAVGLASNLDDGHAAAAALLGKR